MRRRFFYKKQTKISFLFSVELCSRAKYGTLSRHNFFYLIYFLFIFLFFSVVLLLNFAMPEIRRDGRDRERISVICSPCFCCVTKVFFFFFSFAGMKDILLTLAVY